MKRFVPLLLALSATTALAAPAPLTVSLKMTDPHGIIQPMYAYCAPAPGKIRTREGTNQSPQVSWSAGPAGTKSYAIIMHDPDVPVDFSNADKEGKSIPSSAQRQNFFHWTLVDILPTTTRLPAGADSDHVDKNGKQTQVTRYGIRGVNDYGKFMHGTFYGYDGPCPPWNDTRWHHYIFTVYALDVPSLQLKGPFTAQEALKAMQGHVLASGEAWAPYSQNLAVIKSGAPREK